MKKISLILLGLVVLGTLSAIAQVHEIDRVVAIVNDEVITKSELDTQAQIIRNQLTSAGIPIPSPTLFHQKVLQEVINQKLQFQAAANMDIHISTAELNKAIQHIAEKNHITVDELYDSLHQKGLTVNDFKKEIRNEILIQRLQEKEVISRISISQTEIDNFTQPSSENLSTYRVGDLLIALPANPSPAVIDKAKQQAITIFNRLKKGADFKQEAMNLPYDLALQGGDLGWRTLPELPEAFAASIKKMRIGDLTSPIQTPNGFHILKLLDLKSNASGKSVEEFELQLIVVPQSQSVKNEIDSSAQLIKTIAQQIKTGSDFSKLAKKYSQDTTTASQGGYKGWVSESDLNPVIYQSVKKLAVSQVSQPLQTQEGWYLVKVLAKRQVQKFDSLEKSKVQQMIFQRKIAEGIEAMINHLREDAYIQILTLDKKSNASLDSDDSTDTSDRTIPESR